QDALDELLNSVDLSTYGLERVKLNATIGLDDDETTLDPQNPNPRGVHGSDEEIDLLDVIVNSFNERWFQGWDATVEEQRIRFVNMAQKMREHPDLQSKVIDNPDTHTRDLAYVKIFDEVMNQQRRSELDLYRMISQDDAFKSAMQDTVKRILKI
ncbi:MAG: type I restriction endonuclease subunit R, partial [Epsilonproteobacteria bacterium]